MDCIALRHAHTTPSAYALKNGLGEALLALRWCTHTAPGNVHPVFPRNCHCEKVSVSQSNHEITKQRKHDRAGAIVRRLRTNLSANFRCLYRHGHDDRGGIVGALNELDLRDCLCSLGLDDEIANLSTPQRESELGARNIHSADIV